MTTSNSLSHFLREHKHLLAHLRTLEQCAEAFRLKGYSKRRAAQFAHSLEAVDQEVRFDNLAEERALLGVLEQVPPLQGPTLVIRQEHKELRRVARRLHDAFLTLEKNPKNKFVLAKLRLTTELLVKLLREHIRKEDRVFFPLAQSCLTPEQLKRVDQRFKKVLAAT